MTLPSRPPFTACALAAPARSRTSITAIAHQAGAPFPNQPAILVRPIEDSEADGTAIAQRRWHGIAVSFGPTDRAMWVYHQTHPAVKHRSLRCTISSAV